MYPILNPMLLQHMEISFPRKNDAFPKDGCHLGPCQLSDLLADQFLLILQLLFFKNHLLSRTTLSKNRLRIYWFEKLKQKELQLTKASDEFQHILECATLFL